MTLTNIKCGCSDFFNVLSSTLKFSVQTFFPHFERFSYELFITSEWNISMTLYAPSESNLCTKMYKRILWLRFSNCNQLLFHNFLKTCKKYPYSFSCLAQRNQTYCYHVPGPLKNLRVSSMKGTRIKQSSANCHSSHLVWWSISSQIGSILFTASLEIRE